MKKETALGAIRDLRSGIEALNELKRQDVWTGDSLRHLVEVTSSMAKLAGHLYLEGPPSWELVGYQYDEFLSDRLPNASS